MGQKKSKFKHLKGLKGRIESSISGSLRALMVASLVIVQCLIIMVLPLLLNEYFIAFYILLEVVAIIAVISLTNNYRSTAYKFAWLCIIVVLPISGYIMFALWGKIGKRNKLHNEIKKQIKEVDKYLFFDKRLSEEIKVKHPENYRMSRYMEAEGSPLYKNNEATYFETGEEVMESILEDLSHAKKFIFMEFFIVAEGAIWDKVHEVLVQKAKEGVEIKFLYDDFGALIRTGKDFAKNLREEGIEVGIFNPIHKYIGKLFMNYRTHEKIIVIDGEIAYTGGFNLADEYANLIERFGIWKDAGIRIKGDAVWGMSLTFLELWTVSSQDSKLDIEKYKIENNEIKNDNYCHVLRDGPSMGARTFIGHVYEQMAEYTDNILYVMTPYLILEEFMIEAFVQASKRGVDVRIITPNIPDKKQVKHMTEYNYGILLKNGIRIYEYTPGFIHSKVVLNDTGAIVGTINMDYRSFYLHYENGIWISDQNIEEHIYDDFKNTFEVSKEITYEMWKNRPKRKKILQQFLHVFDTLV